MHLLADDQLRGSLDTQMVTNEEIDQAGLAIEKAWGFSKGTLDALARCQRVLLSPWRGRCRLPHASPVRNNIDTELFLDGDAE
jgi:hypothetical protein